MIGFIAKAVVIAGLVTGGMTFLWKKTSWLDFLKR